MLKGERGNNSETVTSGQTFPISFDSGFSSRFSLSHTFNTRGGEKMKTSGSLKILLLSLAVFSVLVLSLPCFVAPVHAEEPTLMTIFSDLGFTNINLTDVETFYAGTYNITLYAEFAGWHNINELSYYELSDQYNYIVIFSGPEGGSGYIVPPINKSFTADDEFGLSMLSNYGRRYFTQNSRNGDGKIHSVVYENLDDPGMYLIGFENTWGGGDEDYNDMVFSLKPCPANTPPVLNPIGDKTVNELTTLSFTATATDPEVPPQTLTFSLGPSAPSGASITSGGAFTWTPTEAQGPGSYVIRIIVSDGIDQDYEDITVTVYEVNQPPVLNPIGDKSVSEGTTLSFTATASDADIPSQTLTFSLGAGAPSGASITSGGAFSWTPTEAQGPGVYSINVTVSDGVTIDYEIITVTVTEGNQPPVLNPIGNKTVNELSTLSFTATASDPDIPPQTLTFSLGPGAPSGASITSGGAFSWTPTEAQGPGVYSINITVSDGIAIDYEVITVTVNEVNLPPVLDPIGPKSVNEGNMLSFTATATDSDIPTQTLTFSLGAGAPSGASITSGGVFTWTPTESQGPAVYSINITVSDGIAIDYEVITVTVNEVNQPPILSSIGDKSVNELATLSFTATATDPDIPTQTLTFSLGVGAPSGASITSGGAFNWTPTEAQGPNVYNINITVSDGIAIDYEIIQVTVNEVNTPPVLDPIGPKSVNEGTTLSFTATASDSDIPVQTLTFSLGPGAPSGASITSGGTFTWTPTEGQGPGVYNINVTISDGVAIDYEVIAVTVFEVNVAPVLDPIGSKSVNEGSTLSFTATASDSDIPAQTLTFSLGPSAPAGASITSGGAFSWTPTEAQGPGVYNINVTVSDGIAIDYEVITVTVYEVNQPPVLNPIGPKSVNEGTTLSFTAIATDSDVPPQTLTFSLGPGAPSGASITSGGVFTWTPTESQGPNVYNINITVSDGIAMDYEVIEVTVTEGNQPPVLNPIGDKTVNELATLSFTATASDSDMPPQTLTFSLGPGAPSGASITSGGAFSWTPTEAQGPGVYYINITVSDGIDIDYEVITVTVNEVNVAPVLDPIGNKNVDELSTLSFTATASDDDIPAQTLTFSLGPGAPSGASITSGGAFSWTPTEAQGPGNYVIRIIVSDGTAEDYEDITVTVNEVNVAPVLNPIGDKTVFEESLLQFTVTASDSDVPAQTLTYSVSNLPPGATFNPNTHVFTWTPTSGQAGVYYNIHFEVSDGYLKDSEDITITVKPKSVIETVGGSALPITLDLGTPNSLIPQIGLASALSAVVAATIFLVRRRKKTSKRQP